MSIVPSLSQAVPSQPGPSHATLTASSSVVPGMPSGLTTTTTTNTPNSSNPANPNTNATITVNSNIKPTPSPSSTSANIINRLSSMNESTWLQIASISEAMGDMDRAFNAYEHALRHNPYSVPTLTQLGTLHKSKENYAKSAEYLQRILNIDNTNGEVWGALGHVYLMMDDLQKAYSAYQQSLACLNHIKEPKIWFGIGLLYDRNGSYDYAEEAFSTVLKIDPHFEKSNEVYFRLAVIQKKLGKFDYSLQYLKYILNNPPAPLTELDIWFQIGHVYEQRKDFGSAKDCYERVLSSTPKHAKVLQQLGWFYQIESSPYYNPDTALSYLNKSLEYDNKDAQTWYLIGRCRMIQQEYNKAYDAFHEAVMRDGSNPSFWCSIGVLYYQIKQYLDALNAYTRAIGINPYISEIWYDLGTLYEACKNQPADAIDAYTRALELDPSNQLIQRKIQYLKTGSQPPSSEKSLQIKPPTFYAGPQPPSLSREDSRKRKENVINGPPLTKEISSRLNAERGGPNYSSHSSQIYGKLPLAPSQQHQSQDPMEVRKQSLVSNNGSVVRGIGQGYTNYEDMNRHRRQSFEAQYASPAPMRGPVPRPLDMNGIDNRYNNMKSSPASATYPMSQQTHLVVARPTSANSPRPPHGMSLHDPSSNKVIPSREMLPSHPGRPNISNAD